MRPPSVGPVGRAARRPASTSNSAAARTKRSNRRVLGSPPSAYIVRAKTGIAAKQVADRATSRTPLKRVLKPRRDDMLVLEQVRLIGSRAPGAGTRCTLRG